MPEFRHLPRFRKHDKPKSLLWGEIDSASVVTNSYHALEARVRRRYEQCQSSDGFVISPPP